jgi:hypothetical protein
MAEVASLTLGNLALAHGFDGRGAQRLDIESGLHGCRHARPGRLAAAAGRHQRRFGLHFGARAAALKLDDVLRCVGLVGAGTGGCDGGKRGNGEDGFECHDQDLSVSGDKVQETDSTVSVFLCNNRAMYRKPLIDKGFVKNLEYCSMLPTND